MRYEEFFEQLLEMQDFLKEVDKNTEVIAPIQYLKEDLRTTNVAQALRAVINRMKEHFRDDEEESIPPAIMFLITDKAFYASSATRLLSLANLFIVAPEIVKQTFISAVKELVRMIMSKLVQMGGDPKSARLIFAFEARGITSSSFRDMEIKIEPERKFVATLEDFDGNLWFAFENDSNDSEVNVISASQSSQERVMPYVISSARLLSDPVLSN